MMVQHATSGKRGCLFAVVAALACGLATAASAEVHVEGNPAALRFTASGDALSDVLAAFAAQWPVTYRTSVPLNAEIEGAYSGSLSQVVARLLDGYNYAIKQESGLTEIIVFGKQGEAAVVAPVRPVKGLLSRWR
jgi:hypothetical protein